MTEEQKTEEQPKKKIKAYLLGIPCAVCSEICFVDKLTWFRVLMTNQQALYICSQECGTKFHHENTPFWMLTDDLMDEEGNIINEPISTLVVPEEVEECESCGASAEGDLETRT